MVRSLRSNHAGRWDDLSIEDLRVGTNSISFTRAKTDKGIEYRIDSKEGGWRSV